MTKIKGFFAKTESCIAVERSINCDKLFTYLLHLPILHSSSMNLLNFWHYKLSNAICIVNQLNITLHAQKLGDLSYFLVKLEDLSHMT